MDLIGVRALFDYHYATFDRVWQSIVGLTKEQFVEETAYSLGSVRSHMVHCMYVDDAWLARLQMQPPPSRLEATDYADQAAVRHHWDGVRESMLEYVSKVSEAELKQIIPIILPSRFSGARESARWEILLHVVNHGTDHRAQILARLHELGAATFEQDLILHLWDADLESA